MNQSLASITWSQTVVFLGCLSATLVAQKYFPGDSANVTMVVALIINFLLGRTTTRV